MALWTRYAAVATSAAVLLVVASAAGARDPGLLVPFGAPVPTQLTVRDLTSAENESGAARGAIPGARLCRSSAERPIALPADDAAHTDALEEWWFWTAHLKAADGTELQAIVFVFSRGASGPSSLDYAVVNPATGEFRYAREPLIQSRQRRHGKRFSFRGRRAAAVGGGGRDALRIGLQGDELELRFRSLKRPAVLFGDGHETAYCNRAYFYARPRMSITGRLRRARARGGGVVKVKGQGWFDHAWGFFPALTTLTWQYVQMQLDDGRDMFVGHLTLPGGAAELSVGMISAPDGSVTTLGPGDFDLRPIRHWSPRPGCGWPVEFGVRVHAERFRVVARVPHAEFRPTSLHRLLWPEIASYWDAPATVAGDRNGVGWLDLGGYCRGAA